MGIPVSHENIGIPTLGLMPKIFTGIPRRLGEPHGASGAQLIGIARHPHHPNPHESPSARFFITVSISFSAWGESHTDIMPQLGFTLVFTRDPFVICV
jgi:hypothetical protein